MNEQMEAKLRVINAMINSLGKLTTAEIRLKFSDPPEPAKAADVAKMRKLMGKKIDVLQAQIAVEWTESAADVEEALRAANTRVQSYILNIKKNINVVNNAIKLVGQIDDAMTFLDGLVPGH